MKAYARMNHVRQSPYKVRRVLDLVRGMPVEDAEDVLTHTQRRASDVILKCLRSAIANAEENHKVVDVDDLYIKEVYVDAGAVLKRQLTRARGMANLLLKRTSHITLILNEKD